MSKSSHSHSPRPAPASVSGDSDSLTQRLLDQAADEGRDTLIGMSLDNDDGSSLVVRDFGVKLEYVDTDHTWAGLTGGLIRKGLLWERRRRMLVGPKLPDSRWPAGKRWPLEERVPYHIYDNVPTVCVDEYDAEGRLTGIQMVAVPGHKEAPDPTPHRTIDINVPTDRGQKPIESSSIFDLITETQREHELEDLSGLKYSLRGQDVTIEREVWIRTRTLDGWKQQRSFVIKRAIHGGYLESWDTITVDTLKQELDGLKAKKDPGITDNYGRSERQDLNLRFEVPPIPSDTLAERHREQMKLRDHEMLDPAVQKARQLKPEQALYLLCGADIYKDKKLDSQKAITEAIPETKFYIEALIEASRRIGTDRLLKTAREIREAYLLEREKIGLKPAGDDKSISWVLLEIAEQEVSHGPILGNSADDGHADRIKQRELVECRIGEIFDKAAVRRRQDDPRAVIERLPDGSVKMEDDPVSGRRVPVQHVVMAWQIEHNDQVIRELDKIIRDSVDALFKEITPDNRNLTYAQKVYLGRLLSGR